MLRPGLMAVTAVLVMALAVAAIALMPDERGRYEVTAVFDQAHGLVAGGRVWAGGEVVGKVSDIHLGRDGLPRVRMSIDDGYALRGGATADLRLVSNSGELNRVVVLTAGTGPRLGDGAVISTDRTDQPVELDDVLDVFSPQMRSDVRRVVARLDGATGGLDRAFRDGLRESAGAFSETAGLLKAANSDGAALRTLITQGGTVSRALAADRSALGESTRSLSELLTQTAARGSELRASVRAMPGAVGSARAALEELRTAAPVLGRLLDAAGPAARELVPTSRLLARALPAAAPAVRDLARTISTAPRDLSRLTPLLRAAEPSLKTLTPLMRDVLPILDVTRVYTPEVAGFLSNWSGIASTYDAAGHGVRLMNSGVRPPDKVVSPDSVEPGYIDSPFVRTPGALTNEAWKDYRSSFLSEEPSR